MLMQTVKLILFIERYLHERWGTSQGKFYTPPGVDPRVFLLGAHHFFYPQKGLIRGIKQHSIDHPLYGSA